VSVQREHVDIADVASLTEFAGRDSDTPEPKIH
jgi:hypothetical protein